MKKWLIFAVIAAMFLVMFPSCKSEEGEPVADTVIARVEGSGSEYVVVTWNGNGGNDYGVYSMKKGYPLDATSEVTIKLVTMGQRQIRFYDPNNDGAFVTDGQLNLEEDQWSTRLTVADFTTTSELRFGVGAANPGGYPLDQFTIVWDTESDTDLGKIQGFFE